MVLQLKGFVSVSEVSALPPDRQSGPYFFGVFIAKDRVFTLMKFA